MATGGGLAVVDWRSPGHPEVLVETSVPGVAVWDVKVEGDLLAISSQGENDRGDGGDPAAIGTHFYDVSDPTDPTLLSEWRVEDAHPELDEPTNFVHDVFVQDDLAYLAYWDAGCRVLDVSNPADPTEVSSFGVASDAADPVEFPSSEWVRRAFLRPGNAHYVQPSPDGNHVYVGAETFPGAILDDPGPERHARPT